MMKKIAFNEGDTVKFGEVTGLLNIAQSSRNGNKLIIENNYTIWFLEDGSIYHPTNTYGCVLTLVKQRK